MRCGSALRTARIELDAVDDIAAIGGQYDAIVRFVMRAARLGELPGNPRHFDQGSVDRGLEPLGHRVEQAGNTRHLLRDRIAKAFRAVAALKEEAPPFGQLGHDGAQPRRILMVDDRCSAGKPRFDCAQQFFISICRHLAGRSAAPAGREPAEV